MSLTTNVNRSKEELLPCLLVEQPKSNSDSLWNENGLVIIYNNVGYCLIHQTGMVYSTSLNLEELDRPEAPSTYSSSYLQEARIWNSGVTHIPIEELACLEMPVEWTQSVTQALLYLK